MNEPDDRQCKGYVEWRVRKMCWKCDVSVRNFLSAHDHFVTFYEVVVPAEDAMPCQDLRGFHRIA